MKPRRLWVRRTGSTRAFQRRKLSVESLRLISVRYVFDNMEGWVGIRGDGGSRVGGRGHRIKLECPQVKSLIPS